MSQEAANKAVRVLTGKPLKFTVMILFKDGTEIEFQSDDQPTPAYNEQTRSCFYRYDAGGTGYIWACQVDDVRLLRCEKTEAAS